MRMTAGTFSLEVLDEEEMLDLFRELWAIGAYVHKESKGSILSVCTAPGGFHQVAPIIEAYRGNESLDDDSRGLEEGN